ncbi:unnamed protein product [Prorocentrum cordatum]|uniref:Uncharacterized protein n=1 Tax=Prorocentrum cordatum TaxID=2364126 RepID=A0ABN9VC17_9DINO|nr:unnamed protein product [Polarella glacialis]
MPTTKEERWRARSYERALQSSSWQPPPKTSPSVLSAPNRYKETPPPWLVNLDGVLLRRHKHRHRQHPAGHPRRAGGSADLEQVQAPAKVKHGAGLQPGEGAPEL